MEICGGKNGDNKMKGIFEQRFTEKWFGVPEKLQINNL